ncbi:MAG: lipid-A-disaccharide synthase [Gammaproteobacteria bacterium]|nr:lipid-A-disaccharide synthase [Gammaproteobacteria bacterium]
MVAGEASGDTLGADLIAALKRRYPQARFVGIGGPKMIAQGFESWAPMEKLSVMGFFEVLKHLPELLQLRKQTIKHLLELSPDVFIGIDAPDFNFRIESRLKEHGITAIHYVGPSIWAWREKRLLKIKRSVDGVLVLFPFEPPYYHRYGIPVKFVGHPLAHRFTMHPDQKAARQQLGLPNDANITAILPGSRMSEIERMADVYIQAASLIQQKHPDMHFIVPCIHQKARQRICDQAIVTSGTATLECALLKRPMVLAIKIHPLSYWIMKRLATTPWIGLPNILAGESLVIEFIQQDATPDKIAGEINQLIDNPQRRQRQISAFEKQHIALKQNASELASDAIIEWAGLPSPGRS